MMKTHRTTYTLLGLFIVSLLVLWGLKYSGVATDKDRRLRESRVLHDLLETTEASIRKLVVERGKERLVFERRGGERPRWQMVEPVDAAAAFPTLPAGPMWSKVSARASERLTGAIGKSHAESTRFARSCRHWRSDCGQPIRRSEDDHS